MDETLPQGPEEPEFGATRSSPPLPELIKVVDHSPALERGARKAGRALGRLVAAVRESQEKLRGGGGESASEKIRLVTGQGTARVEEIRQTASSWAQAWRRVALGRVPELQDRAQVWWNRTQERARTAAREKPVQVALAAGGAGFLLGVALRFRRARHAG